MKEPKIGDMIECPVANGKKLVGYIESEHLSEGKVTWFEATILNVPTKKSLLLGKSTFNKEWFKVND